MNERYIIADAALGHPDSGRRYTIRIVDRAGGVNRRGELVTAVIESPRDRRGDMFRAIMEGSCLRARPGLAAGGDRALNSEAYRMDGDEPVRESRVDRPGGMDRVEVSVCGQEDARLYLVVPPDDPDLPLI